MNTPYVKQYDQNRELINPLNGSYLHSEPNREQRKFYLKKAKHHNNRKETLGRRLQITNNGRQIVHETNSALIRKTALFNFMQRIETLKSKWHDANPEYKKKQLV